jgi:glycosyltransferase involved in cell wall biosynthesis
MHILWLASWYPNRTNPFDGDFIQRHALAMDTQVPLAVIHIAKDKERSQAFSVTRRGRLTETIGYFKAPNTRSGVLNGLISQYRRLRLYHKAFRQHIREQGKPDLIHVHICIHAGVYALWVKWRYGIPYAVMEHYTVYVPGSLDNYYERSSAYRWLNRLILKKAQVVCSTSNYLLNAIEAITPVKQACLLPNAVDETLFFPPTKQIPAGREPFRFIHVSTLVPHKNVEGILNALAKLRQDWVLDLVGPPRASIQALVKDLNLAERVRFSGEIPNAQVGERMRQAQAFILFSRFENQPCVISEALCTGLPVISSEVGGVSEVLDASNGILVPDNDLDRLTEACEQMILTYHHYHPLEIARTAFSKHHYARVGEVTLSCCTNLIQP